MTLAFTLRNQNKVNKIQSKQENEIIKIKQGEKKKSMKPKAGFFEINKIDKTLARLMS